MPSQRALLQDLLCERPHSSSRPSTARDIERQLELVDEKVRCRATATSPPTPSTVASAGLEIVTLPEVSAKPSPEVSQSPFSLKREERRNLLVDVLRLRERQSQEEVATLVLLILQSWRRQCAETLRELAGAQKREEVQAAREGRKGLFVAALGQQARYWMAKAFSVWRQTLLEARCERIRASSASTGKRAGLGPIPSASPRNATQHRAPSPRCSMAGAGSGTAAELVVGAARPRRPVR